MSRPYTVWELDALRQAMERKILFGTYGKGYGGASFSRGYKDDEKIKMVEEMVRTAMIAGHTAEDYIASEKIT